MVSPARISHLYDFLNDLVMVAYVDSCSVGQSVLAGEYLIATRVMDLFLYDRGYLAF